MKNHNHVTIRNDDSYNDNNNGHLVLSESDSSCSSLFKSNDWYSVGKILAIDALGLRALTVGRRITGNQFNWMGIDPARKYDVICTYVLKF